MGNNEPSQDRDGIDSLLREMDTGQCYGLDALAAFSGLNTAEIFSGPIDFKAWSLIRRSETGQFVHSRG